MKKKSIKAPHGLDSAVSFERIGKSRLGREIGDFSDNLRMISHIGIFYFAVFFVALIFIGRVFTLTVVRGDENRKLADDNRVKLVRIEPARGSIVDRNSVAMASSKRVFHLVKGDSQTEITEQTARDLEIQGLASENFEGELGTIKTEVVRQYQLGEASAHVLGYVGKVSEGDLEINTQLVAADSIGRLGVEASYDSFLRGKAGQKLVEVDALGKNVSILGNQEAEAGRDIKLTIDSAMQKVAYSALVREIEKVKAKKGAVIVQNPQTGEVLALVSYPTFDPLNVSKFINADNQPLFNRVVQGNYPPGSVFKIVTSLAGLESGKITKDTEIEDVGEFYLGDVRFSNWYFTQYGKKDGVVKIDKAIARSNDIYFYRAAEMTTLANIRKMALAMGFGQKTGIDLPDENFGLVPDEVWKESTFATSWYPGDTMHLGIGQGFMLTTPIQVNWMTSYVASDKLVKPHLVAEIAGDSLIKLDPKVVSGSLVHKENLDTVRDGMRKACIEGGTAWTFFDAPYAVGCKTGTAEQIEGHPHAWFTAYAPYDAPKVAVTVLIEDGGEGSSVAGPVAREILDAYFKK